MPTRFRCLRPALLTLLLGQAALGQGLSGLNALSFSAQGLRALGLPPDYFGRFGGLSTLGDPDDWGVRGFPLPLTQDVRLTLVRHSSYSEFGLQTRAHDTGLTLGSFENTDAGPAYGVFRLEALHDPFSGPQVGLAVRGAGRVSTFSLGYAWGAGPGRALAEVGYGVQGALRSPYARLELSALAAKTFGPVRLSLTGTARAFIFPDNVQHSADLIGNLTWQPDPAFFLSLTHFQRVVGGQASLPDLALGDDRHSNLALVYALPQLSGPGRWAVQLAGAEYHYERNWANALPDRNELSATLRLDFSALYLNLSPRCDFSLQEWGLRGAALYRLGNVAVGPLIDYAHGRARTKWSFGIAFASL